MSTPSLHALRDELRSLADAATARQTRRYFKTGPGGYAEGDRFLGVRMPALRGLARRYRGLPRWEILALLRSEWHEERMLALLLLVQEYPQADEERRGEIYRDYLANTRWIDSWDLVDTSAEHIVGAHLWERGRGPLEELAGSDSVWERRIDVLATLYFIRRGDYAPTLHLAERLLSDRHDLVHRAVGWMLREIGQWDPGAAEAFVARFHASMPRTMLRYAIVRR